MYVYTYIHTHIQTYIHTYKHTILQAIEEPEISLRAMLTALKQAAKDERVKGLVLRIPTMRSWSIGFGCMQELCESVLEMRRNGKVHTYAFIYTHIYIYTYTCTYYALLEHWVWVYARIVRKRA